MKEIAIVGLVFVLAMLIAKGIEIVRIEEPMMDDDIIRELGPQTQRTQ